MSTVAVLVVVILAVAVVVAVVRRRRIRKWPTVTGTIVDLRRRRTANLGASNAAGLPAGSIAQTTWMATIDYVSSDGSHQRVERRVSRRLANEQGVGSPVSLAVHPTNPRRVIVRNDL